MAVCIAVYCDKPRWAQVRGIFLASGVSQQGMNGQGYWRDPQDPGGQPQAKTPAGTSPAMGLLWDTHTQHTAIAMT